VHERQTLHMMLLDLDGSVMEFEEKLVSHLLKVKESRRISEAQAPKTLREL